MFTAGDMLALNYFDVVKAQDGDYELVSKNTKHRWKIMKEGKLYTLFHSYTKEKPYHVQGYFEQLLDVVLDIVDHDDYMVRKSIKKNKKTKLMPRKKTMFDELVEAYVK